MLLSLSKINLNYYSQQVLSDIDFSIDEKEKIALIGRNGCGKTSLLKIIVGDIEASSGSVYKNSNIKIGYLSQISFDDLNKTIKEEMYRVFDYVIELEKEISLIADKLKDNPNLLEKYDRMIQEFESLNGYNYEVEIKTILYAFGFEDFDRRLGSFSGGEQTKLQLCKLLLQKPDLLILDEPTNHLDLKAIEWLENYLKNYKKSLILVSHDRYFINKVVDTIYELEYGNLTKYKGSYDDYLIKKKQNIENNLKIYNIQQKEIKEIEEVIERFRYKASKASFAQSKIKYLERMDKVSKLNEGDLKTFKADLTVNVKGGKNVLSLLDLEYGYLNKSLGKITLDIIRGERICLIGKNGSGKSTLLNTIVDKIDKLSGYKMLGHQIEIGYYDQNQENINKNNTVIDEIWNEYPELNHSEVRTVLGNFLFSKDSIFKNIHNLSGGEKARLLLAKLILKKANFIILDEPTNHLDIPSRESLEELLLNYEGTILFVSHDRYFINKIATKIISLDDLSFELQKTSILKEEKPEVKKDVKVKVKQKYNLKKIESELVEMENLLELKRNLRYEEEYYHSNLKMEELNNEIDDLVNKVHNLYSDWENAIREEEEFKK